MESIKLTQYSHGAGCGCKISPAVLEDIIKTQNTPVAFSSLLVGNESKDDAAVYDLGDGSCVISTTDFFMPIVDDPFTFGSIASVNAISDVYAMGGEPLMAVAILGWPVNKVPTGAARQVLEGGRDVCHRVGIPLAGGHSIDCPEPVFGLAVTGRVQKAHLKRNDTARGGDLLYLTKPLGIGIVTTAQKKGIVKEPHLQRAVETMLTVNSLGGELGKLPYVTALTDVTGFGLLGHLTEMCEGAGLSAEIEFKYVPKFDFLEEYISQKSMPGGTFRNLESYGMKIADLDEKRKLVLADPQTSGGLLVAVDPAHQREFEALSSVQKLGLRSLGKFIQRSDKAVYVS